MFETQLPVLVNHLQIFKNILCSQVPSMNQLPFYLCLSRPINTMKYYRPFFHSREKVQNGEKVSILTVSYWTDFQCLPDAKHAWNTK